MALFFGRPYRRKRIQFLLIASISIFLGVLLFSRHLLFDTLRQSPFNKSSYPFGRPSPNSSGSPSIPKSKPGTYAVAIFLGTEFDAEEDDEDNADRYYVGVRTLVYQMLHAPSTRFTSPISVVILAAEGVRESKRQRLRRDGAVVIDTEKIEHSVDIDVPGYHQVFDKLRAFDPSVMPFGKVALLDADMVITRPLDLLFQDTNSTQFPVNLNSTKPPPSGLPELPDNYAIAATPDIPGRNDSVFPPDVDHEENRDYFNAGVIVSSPSQKLFQFYLALLTRPELYGHWLPEQDLLNFAHHWDGPMPWRQLDLSWHLIRPTDTDFHAGMAILHCKYWEFVADRCHNTALARRWEMEGFWEGREGRK